MSLNISEFQYLIKSDEPEDRKQESLELYSNLARHFVERAFGIEAGQLCVGQRKIADEMADSDLLDSKPTSTTETFKSAAKGRLGGNSNE